MGVNREYQRWFSPALNRDMELLAFGHAGAAVLVFPTSMGRFYQYEDSGMVETLSYHIDQGWIQLFCVDSVDGESWYNYSAPPHDRAVRHEQYEAYILQEAMPYIYGRNRSGYLIATGNSFGAYHAVNLALRHPDRVHKVIAISGAYGVPGSRGGYQGDDVYYNSPVDYLPNLGDAQLPGSTSPHRHAAGGRRACRHLPRQHPTAGRYHGREGPAAPTGRLGPGVARLALVAPDDPQAYLVAPAGAVRERRMPKIGLLVGRENTFPPAFIAHVNDRGTEFTAEYCQLGGSFIDEAPEYAVIIDRISHEVPYYRSY